METKRTYLCIDLKSFYASVECVERDFDPMTYNLVVADPSRTEKTICLAVSPALKTYGISGRARLFEVISKVNQINRDRQKKAPHGRFEGESCDAEELRKNPALKLSYYVAPPRMAKYMEVSSRIYEVYLRYVAPEDIHVYSIDEVFMDITDYLRMNKISDKAFAKQMIQKVYETTGIRATAGIGTNLYLAKIAMDIVAKHTPLDEDGVAIAKLDELSYRQTLWSHRPITDFWRVGKGYAKKLEANRLYTMGDIAKASLTPYGKNLLFRLFGISAELLIDHAWGYEPCTMAHIKAYQPENRSLGSGQVLHCPYPWEKAKLVVKEMAEQLSLDLVDKGLETDQIVLTVGYDIENLKDPKRKKGYQGEITVDYYGRQVPRHAHGTENLEAYTASSLLIVKATEKLFERIADPELLVRRVNLCANHIFKEGERVSSKGPEQLDFFTDYEKNEERRKAKELYLKKEKSLQKATLAIKKRFGKNALFKGNNLQEGATARDRNKQIGGHKA